MCTRLKVLRYCKENKVTSNYSVNISYCRMSLDSGMIVVIMISMMYMVLVFGLLFYVKNDWCDLLFKNFTVMFKETKLIYNDVKTISC